MKVYDSRGNPVWLGECAGHGGEASVFRVVGRPHLLAKIYEPAPRQNYDQKLAWMIAHPPQNPTHSLNHASLAWPVDLLFNADRGLAGYLMPFIQVAVPVLEVFNPRRRSQILPQFDRRYLHRAARNLAAALRSLHQGGYVAGDLNESNIMITPRALATLIDTDSYQVETKNADQDSVYPCPVGKYEYTPPELQGQSLSRVRRTPEHDAFGLGVLIFQLLMDGSHPFRAQWLGEGDPPPIEKRIALGAFPYMSSPPCPVRPPKNAPALHLLHPSLAELARRCFVDGHHDPGLRPGPAAWEKALAVAEETLIRCPQGHLYSNHLRDCPACTPVLDRAPASSPAPRLREKPAAEEPAPASLGRIAPSPVLVIRGPTRAAATTPPTSQPAAARPVQVFRWPAIPKIGWRNWVQPRIYKSFLLGGSLGALAGASIGALVGVASWSAGGVASWGLLWALGGAAAGMARGWQPGQSFGVWVNRTIGWSRFWQAIGLVAGALVGILPGLLLGWAILPICLMPVLFAFLGARAGQEVWRAGTRLGWERIWTGVSLLGAALLGWMLAGLAASSGLGTQTYQLAVSLATWVVGASASWALVYLLVGALAGALGGAIAGVFTDLFARLTGLVN